MQCALCCESMWLAIELCSSSVLLQILAVLWESEPATICMTVSSLASSLIGL